MNWVAKMVAELSREVDADEFVQYLEYFLKRKVRLARSNTADSSDQG